MRKILAVMILLLVSLPVFSQSAKNIPYEDPVYEFLDKCYSKGWIYYIPDVKPYTEKRALGYLREVRALFLEEPERFTPEDKEKLFHHIDRLEGNKFNLFRYETENIQADLNLAPHAEINSALNEPSDSAIGGGSEFMIDLYAYDNFYMGLRSDIYMTADFWEDAPYPYYRNPHKPDFNMYTYNLSEGTKSFNHDAERHVGDTDVSIRMDQTNQVSADFRFAHISFGRNALNWGPGEQAALSLSKTSKPYEYFFYDIPLGDKIYFSWMTGFLRDEEAFGATEDQDKLITAHRIEFQPFKWFMFSIYETVVYSHRLALSYINPFSLYYISEVSQGDRDNKFGGMDFVFRFMESKLYFSLFLDDWDFGEALNLNYYHNIGAITAGYKIYDIVPKFDLTLEYTYLSHWMYSHKLFSGNNRSNYSHYGSSVGHYLPPNSQLAFADITYNYSPNLAVGLSFLFTQHSVGDINTHAHDDSVGGWDMGGLYDDWDDNYNFLDYGIDGIVRQSNLEWTLHGEYRVPYYGLKFMGAFTLDYTINKNQIEGDDEWRALLTLAAKWQAY